MALVARFLRWLSGFDRFDFDSVVLRPAVMRQIILFAKRSHPREFSALLGGRIVKEKGTGHHAGRRTLLLTHIVYQHFEASERSATIHLNVPISEPVFGTVHSHPSTNWLPSAADRRYFSKTGFVNFIVALPYTKDTIACYDAKGRPLPFMVGT